MKITSYDLELTDKRIPNLVEAKVSEVDDLVLDKPEKVAKLIDDLVHLSKQAEEHMTMIALDVVLKPFAIFRVSHGTINMSFSGVREIFIRALACGAAHICIAHNHPSGTLAPSFEDWLAYMKIKHAGEIIGISVLDHIIIGNGTYYSMQSDIDMQYLSGVDNQDSMSMEDTMLLSSLL